MGVGAEAAALLEALGEPALLARDGTVLAANRSARALLGADPVGRRLGDFHEGDSAALAEWLHRCLGSSTALVGPLLIPAGDGPDRWQCRGSRVALADGAAVLVRLSKGDEERFRVLGHKVAELDVEVRQRRHAEAVLAEAVRERDLLLRELQHRVKNNMHMLAGILHGAEREAEHAEAKAALRDASLRFAAVSAVQQLLYGSDGLAEIGSDALVRTVAQAALVLAPGGVETSVEVDAFSLPVDAAVPVALIVNELVTNAVKYGRPAEGAQRIAIGLTRCNGTVRLTVADNGPGFRLGEGARRASGIGLVRGLLRRLGGSFEVEDGAGARCTARFPAPAERTARSEA